MNLLRNTGIFRAVEDVNEFVGFLNNYCLTRFTRTILPKSMKWCVLSYSCHPNVTLPDGTNRTSITLSLRWEPKWKFYEVDPDLADYIEDRRDRNMNVHRHMKGPNKAHFSYECACSVVRTHGMACVHVNRVSQVYAEFSGVNDQARNVFGHVFIPMRHLFK